MKLKNLFLPALIFGTVAALPFVDYLANNSTTTSASVAGIEALTPTEIESHNLESWIKRLKCERYYTIEIRSQCYSFAMEHSERQQLAMIKLRR